MQTYPRDLIGYGEHPPHAAWPNKAKIALQFVLNYEEGGENSVLHGDPASEQFLSEMFNPAAFEARHMSMEGIYEYGSRAGVWRILREFEKRAMPLTVFGVGMALQRHPELTAAFVALDHEIACHGWRWINYQNVPEAVEREHMRLGMEAIKKLTGNYRWAGTRGATAPIPTAWSQIFVPLILAVLSTMRITTATTSRFTCPSPKPTAAWCNN